MKETIMFTASLTLLVFASAYYVEWQSRRNERKRKK
jgi:hypothetical protein